MLNPFIHRLNPSSIDPNWEVLGPEPNLIDEHTDLSFFNVIRFQNQFATREIDA